MIHWKFLDPYVVLAYKCRLSMFLVICMKRKLKCILEGVSLGPDLFACVSWRVNGKEWHEARRNRMEWEGMVFSCRSGNE